MTARRRSGWIKLIGRVVPAMLIGIVGLGLAATAFAAWQGGRTPKGRPEYVALGSSFAAGAGLGRLEPGSPLLCARGIEGYPHRVAQRLGLSLVDMACGGAVTRNVLGGGQFFQGPQVRVIDARTRLVTLTVGGNDVGYVGDLSLLAARRTKTPLGWAARRFWKGPRPAGARDYAKLRRELTAVIRDVRARAPQATVIVATYPGLLPAQGTCVRIGLSAEEADLMRDVARRLVQTTQAAARDGGAMLVDMDALSAGHDACAAMPWVNGYVDAGAAPFHPNAAGAEATARAIVQRANGHPI